MTEVTNQSNPISGMSKSEVNQYNRNVKELQESIEKLNNLQQALESKISSSDNSIVSAIISQIESTRQFALKSIENGELGRESTREILRSSYESIQNLLHENRRENVINSNNQIVTLKEILREHDNEMRNQRNEELQKVSNTIKNRQANDSLISQTLTQGVESAASVTSDIAMASTPLGMLVNAAIKPSKQIGSIVKDITKGTVDTTKSIGGAIGSLFGTPSSSIESAKSLEKKKTKETEVYRKKVLEQLELISKQKSSKGEEGGLFSSFTAPMKTMMDKLSPTLLVFPKLLGPLAKIGTGLTLLASLARGGIKFFDDLKKNNFDILKTFESEGDEYSTNAKNGSAWDNIKGIFSGILTNPGKILFETEALITKGLNYWDPLNKHGGNAKSFDESSADISGVPYSDKILEAAKRYNMDPARLAARIQAESNFDPYAKSRAGARGLGQFMPSTWRQYGRGLDINDPEANIDAMARYMADLDKQYDGDVDKVSAAYNWGPGFVNKAIEMYGDNWIEGARSGGIMWKGQRRYMPNETYEYISRNNRYTEAYNVPKATMLADASSIMSADASSQKFLNSQLVYDENSKSMLLDNSSRGYQDMSQVVASLNTSLLNGFTNMSDAFKNSTNVAYNSSTPDDPGMLLINSGGA